MTPDELKCWLQALIHAEEIQIRRILPEDQVEKLIAKIKKNIKDYSDGT